MKSKSKEVTRIGAIASKCCSGNILVVVHRSRIGKREKSDWDEMQRRQERKNTQMVGGGSVSFSVSHQQRQSIIF